MGFSWVRSRGRLKGVRKGRAREGLREELGKEREKELGEGIWGRAMGRGW